MGSRRTRDKADESVIWRALRVRIYDIRSVKPSGSRASIPVQISVCFGLPSCCSRAKPPNLASFAPKPGAYPYICTFPLHWKLMNGVMHVVPEEVAKK